MVISQYCVVEIDPSSKYEWNRCSVRDPLSVGDVDFKHLIASALGADKGSYLVEVRLEVKPLTSRALEPEEPEAIEELDEVIAA
jgi:hypothetical protein